MAKPLGSLVCWSDELAFKQLEEQTGKKQSELVREAVQLLLAEHKIGA